MMVGRKLSSRWRNLPAALVLLVSGVATAQYQLHDLADFEEGKLPADAVRIGPTPDDTISVVELSKVEAGPPAIQETGKFALKLKVTPDPADFKTNSTGISIGKILDRDKLGSTGRALYQADFYIPADGPLPNLAVLAMEVLDVNGAVASVETVRTPFYRFGITNNRQLYFSSFHPQDKASNVFYPDQKLLAQIPRGGWHRFAIVMEGAETIRCYVDGREASFSPFKDPKLRKLLVGVMLADPKGSYNAYADNLSIQVSEDAALMPESPHQAGWKIPPGSNKGQASVRRTPAPTPAPKTTIAWLEASEAWNRAKAERKPLLMYFYAPGLPGTEKMDELFATTPAAREFLARHSATRIDVNQLQGGKIARQYQVFKVPTLITVAPDESGFKRITPSRDASWQSIESELTLR